MNPLSINPLGLLSGSALVLMIGIGIGWQVNGWRKDAQIQTIKANSAHERAALAASALDDLRNASNVIRAAADQYTTTKTELGTQLDALRRDLKNAQTKKPLPVNCRPDADRLRSLQSAVNAANQAAAR